MPGAHGMGPWRGSAHEFPAGHGRQAPCIRSGIVPEMKNIFNIRIMDIHTHVCTHTYKYTYSRIYIDAWEQKTPHY